MKKKRKMSTPIRSSPLLASTRWAVNEFNCHIAKEISNIDQTLSFNINVKKMLKEGASSVNDWKIGSCEKYVSALFLAYIELGRRLFEEGLKMVQLWKKYQPQAEIPENPVECYIESVVADPVKLKIEGIPSQEIYSDFTFHFFVRKVNLPEVNISPQQQDQVQQDDDEEGGEQTTEEGGKGKGKGGKKRGKKGAPRGIPDHEKPELDARVVWAKMLSDIFALHDSSKKTGASIQSRAVADALKNIKAHEKWKTLKNIPLLATLYDFYTGHTNAATNYEKFNTTTLDSDSNLFCATNMFSKMTLASARSRDCVEEQGAEAICRRLFQYDNGRNITVRPTLRKYWLKVNPAEWTPESMFNRVLPWKQGDQMDRLAAALPMILEDWQSHSNIFSRFKDDSANEQGNIRTSVDSDGNIQLLETESSEFKNQEKESDRHRQAMREMIKEMNLEDMFSVDGPSYDPNSLEAADGRSIGTYITPAIQNYVCVYSGLVEFGQQAEKALSSLQNRLLNEKGDLYGKFNAPKAMLYKLRKLVQQYLFKEFMEKCRSESSDISPTGKKIYKYIKDSGLYSKAATVSYQKKDKSLSTFANWEIIQYAYEDQINFVAGTHRYHRLANKYKLDAYRPDLDSIHLNMFTNSEKGATGKSWLWNKMIKHSIPGTVIQESHRSTQAEMVDSLYESDEIVVFHELDLSLIDERTKGGADPNRSRLFKERITSNETNARRNEKDPETGARYTKETRTERITVFFGSTNKDLDAIMEPAMRSRVHAVSYQDNIHFKNISALTVIENILSTSDRSVSKTLITESHLIQALVFELEKMMLCRIIASPSTHVSNIILLLLQEGLVEKGICKASTRDIMRTQLLARLNCILDAVVSTFFFPGGKHYGKEIVPEMLLDLEPLLYCKIQHVVDAIGTQIDLYVDETEANVLKIIRAKISVHPETVQYKYYDGTFSEKAKDTGNNGGKYGMNHFEDPSYFAFKKKINHEFPLISIAESLNSFAKTLAYDDHKKNKQVMDAADIPSTFSIMRVLRNWCEKSITAKRYARDPASREIVPLEKEPIHQPVAENSDRIWYYLHYEFVMGKPSVVEEQQQGEEEEEQLIESSGDEQEDERRIQEWDQRLGSESVVSLRKKQNEKSILKHAGMFGRDAIKSELENILCRRYQLPQRLIFDVDTKTGYIRNVIEITEDQLKNAPYLVIPSPIYMDEICTMLLSDKLEYLDEFRRARGIMIGTDLDTYGMMERNKILYISQDKIDPNFRSLDLFRLDTEKQNHEETAEAASKHQYLQRDDDYDQEEDEGVFFLGRHLRRVIDIVEMSKQRDIGQRIENVFYKLDNNSVEFNDEEDVAAQGEDDAFHPEDYIVRDAYYDEMNDVQVHPLYHWQLESMPDELRDNPVEYKKVCTHPLIREWFVDERYYVDTPMKSYPREAIKQHSERKKTQFNLMKEFAKSDANMKQALRDCMVYCAERGIQVDSTDGLFTTSNITARFSEVSALSSAALSLKRSRTYIRGVESSGSGVSEIQSIQEEEEEMPLKKKKQSNSHFSSIFSKKSATSRKPVVVLSEVSQGDLPESIW